MNNYLVFGLKHKGYNNNISGVEHKWKYNGKELQDELDLNWYDLGARNLDHALGRFMNVDPKAEDYNFQSVYAFANNNPVRFVDINGEGVDWKPKVNEDGSTSYIAENGDSATTMAEQYNIAQSEAEAITNTEGDTEIKANTEVSGQRVKNITGSEVLKLNLNSKLATSQRKFDQYVFGRAHSTTKGGWAFKSIDYFENTTYKNMMIGNAMAVVDGERFKVHFRIPVYRPASFDGSPTFVGLGNQPSPTNVNGDITPEFDVTDRIDFGAYNSTGGNAGHYSINVHRNNTSKLMKLFSKTYPKYNYVGKKLMIKK